MAASTKEFQVRQNTREHTPCLDPRWPTASLTREINPEQSLRALRRNTASLKPGTVEMVVFLFVGLVAAAAIVGCFSQLLQLLGGDALEQTVRALLTK